jgi:MraZ protein
MFQGATSLSLDAKGRMAVPSRHRDALAVVGEGRLVVTAHPHRCLLLYPVRPGSRSATRSLPHPACKPNPPWCAACWWALPKMLELDGAGRLLISPSLRQYAGLEKEIWLIGQGRHFEIWSAAGWQAQQDAIFAVGDKLAAPGPGKPCVVSAD